MKIIACGNQKGGVGKTSTSLNLCYALANTYGKRVLLVDMDSQGSASLNLGIDISDEDTNTIDELLEDVVTQNKKTFDWDDVKNYIYTPTFQDRQRDSENKMQWVKIDKPFGFDCIPASLHLSVVELEMGLIGGMTNRTIYAYYLRDLLKVIEENADYEYVVIDTPPSLGSLSVNSMAAATSGVIIISNLDIMSLRGISSFIESAETVKKMNDEHRGILGILLALYSERRTVDRAIDEWVKEFLPIPTFDTRIPESADVKKANSSMLLFSQINKKGRAAFDAFAEEVIYAIEHPEDPVGSAKNYVYGKDGE